MDLNGDGILDVTSGQYTPGIVTFFEGTPNGFKKGVPLEEAGLDPHSRQDMKSTMATANFVDWDADGDYAMVVGNVLGEVFVNTRTYPKTCLSSRTVQARCRKP